MAVAFRGHIQGTATNGANITLTLTSPTSGAAPQVDDIILVVSTTLNRSGNEGRIGNALSYTEEFSLVTIARFRFAWKLYVSGENSLVVEGSANTQDGMTAMAIWFSGVDTASPFSTTSQSATGFSLPDPPAITPADNDCMIVCRGGINVVDATPGTMTNYTVLGSPTANDNNDSSTALAYRLLSGGSGASENPGTWASWTSTNWGAVTAALKPAAVVPGILYRPPLMAHMLVR